MVAALFTGAGCRPATRQLDADALARSHPRRLLLVLKETTILAPRRASVRTGLVGALESDIGMEAEGEKTMKDSGIADPSLAIGRDLARRFAERHALALSEFRETPPQNAASAYAPRPSWPESDLSLQVHTTTWAIQNRLPDGGEPVVRYTAEARLTDRRKGVTLARAQCVADDGQAAKPVTARYYALFSGTPTPLEIELSRLSRICSARFAAMLALNRRR